jgi:hypothetical protein
MATAVFEHTVDCQSTAPGHNQARRLCCYFAGLIVSDMPYRPLSDCSKAEKPLRTGQWLPVATQRSA